MTKNPTSETSGYIDAYATSDSEQRIKLGASGTLIPEKLTANVSALLGNFDGNVDNLTTIKMLMAIKIMVLEPNLNIRLPIV